MTTVRPLRPANLTRAIALAVTIASPLAIVPATTAQAHSSKESTTPADGATVTATPHLIAIGFNAPMRITMLRLTDGNDTEFPVTRSDNMEPVTRFEAVPPAMPAGAYTVEWRGLSSDGHAMSGRFSFTIAN
ncbi:copper resistance CopC family protein [Roseibium aestuarii]|uniref:Copper resistance protein CopC n=1 Tax=Roseibium aestuarii TaxID=2600299 RepID=A0ABW4K474_9HYPH|nr:copper resistance CopC family protein [Roseibium aestuarii]